MAKERQKEYKPLSFSTTMRNPARIADFLNCILPFEGQLLTEQIIHEVAVNLISKKLYKPTFIGTDSRLKAIYNSEDDFTVEDTEYIIKNSPQQHKEAGFEKGWPSRFDTWYKLPMEFGFIFYAMDAPIEISTTGHMLIDAVREVPKNDDKIQNVFLNAMMKYQTNNPFRKNSNTNAPLPLLLNVIKKLKDDPKEGDSGIFISELSMIICWPDNDADALYREIKSFRKKHRFTYGDEVMYDRCLQILNADSSKKNRFKISQITGEAVDEFIRKMVRGSNIINDATIEDAKYVGLDNVAEIITNGEAIAGTIYELLPEYSKEIFNNSDVILAKGQGNYESLSGQGRHIFYAFLCKCDLFTTRFNVPMLTGMFIEEKQKKVYLTNQLQ